MAAVKKANAELADLAEVAAAEAARLLANAKRALRKARTTAAQRKLDRRPDPVAGRRRGRLVRAVNDLEELLEATRRIAAQTRQRLAGVTPDGSTRRASLYDPDARPIAKGRLGKPVEFGHKAQVVDNHDGVVPARPAHPRPRPADRCDVPSPPSGKTIESMPGFGSILGAQLLVAAGDLRGYPSAGHLAAAAG